MRAKLLVLAIAGAALAMTATSASAIDLSGSYFRSGVGFNSKGGGQACFALPGADFKSRLGNECDQYLEISFSQMIWKDDSGVEFNYQFMPAYGVRTNEDPGAAWGYGNGSLYVQQNWGSVKLPQLGGATIWAGWRYFQRHNIDNLDWFWWNPLQRQGAFGIENVDLGIGKLAITLGRLEPSPAVGAIGTFIVPDIRLGGIQIWPNGSIELGVDLAFAGSGLGIPGGASVPALSPWFTAFFQQDQFLGGKNVLAFQYGQGAFYQMASEGGVAVPTAAGTKVSNCPTCGTSDSKQWRILDVLEYHPIPVFSGELSLVYQNIDYDKDVGSSWFTIQVRPAIHLSDYFKIAADVAYQTEMVKNAPSGFKNPYLIKATLAPTIVAGQKGGVNARPEIRLFATYGAWGNLLPGEEVANGVFGTKDNGLSWGAQMEAWW